MSSKKQIKVGGRVGAGIPPGYKWNVGILDFAYREVMGFLTEAQYQHIAMQVKELARAESPSHCATVSVDAIEDFYELREKGGILGRINVRVFFGLCKTTHSVIILGGIKKESNGPTPQGDKITMRRRWRKYRDGDYGAFTP